jgi:hypothetical protein
MLIQILDILSSILILVGLWNVIKHRAWWLVYFVGSVFFVIVCISKGLPGLTVMGFATCIMGIKNYVKIGKGKRT